MNGTLERRSCRLLNRALVQWAMMSLTFAASLLAAGQTRAQTSPQPDAPVYFDIAPQPLAVALGQYGDMTGREVLYATRQAAGKVSGEVKGFMQANEALQKLLSGTDLSARVLSESAFVLVPNAQRPLSAPRELSPGHRRYYALIQGTLLDALCRSTAAHPGGYRILAMFWVNGSGAIERLERIGSAGAAVDAEIDATLRSARIPEAPPADFAQPVLIELVPRGAGVTAGCSTARATRHSSGGRSDE